MKKSIVDKKIDAVLDDSISEIDEFFEEDEEDLEIVGPVETPSTPENVPSPINEPDKGLESDFQIAQDALRSLLKTQMTFVTDSVELAKERQFDARSVEATAQAMKETRDTAMALFFQHKTRKEIDKMTGNPLQPIQGDRITQTNNIVFQGTTSDLLKHMKEFKALPDAKIIEIPSTEELEKE